MPKQTVVLAIESSCDETSASVVKDGRQILSNVISSQIKIHTKYAGVVPELASRAHLENINSVIATALNKAGSSINELSKTIDAITYTQGPGLAGALLVGQIAARTLAFTSSRKLVPINHLEGHIYSAMLENKGLKPPYLCLIASGGHSELVILRDYGVYEYLGGTCDDAAGEAFDKVAKLLGLPYPGGPSIEKLAATLKSTNIKFPQAKLKGEWDFSFSGLKTAVLYYLKENPKAVIAEVAYAFQKAVVDALSIKTFNAAKKYKISKVAIGGGVGANLSLRTAFKTLGKVNGCKVFLPSLGLCTDNAAMLACAAYYKIKHSKNKFIDGKIEPSMPLRNW